MHILPAIDLYGGKAVRLFQGDYNQMTVYSDDPVGVARDFKACGAKQIHLVDLEGAKTGDTPNLGVISEIVKTTGLIVEVGGGIRSDDIVARYLDAGVARTILGTAAVTNPVFLERMVERHGEAIAVSADVRDGMVAIRGWTQKTEVACDAFMQRLAQMGVSTVVCTDISRDGAMRGANHALYRRLKEKYPMHFIASGGVSSMEDVKTLGEIGVWGAIVGKAYYTGAIDLKEAILAAGGGVK